MPSQNDKNEPETSPTPLGVGPVESDEKVIQYGKTDYSKAQNLRFYANHVAVNMTLFDVRLVLSDVDVAGDGVSAVQTLTVLMSPEIAEVARLVLDRALQTYKGRFGATRLPTPAAQTDTPNKPK